MGLDCGIVRQVVGVDLGRHLFPLDERLLLSRHRKSQLDYRSLLCSLVTESLIKARLDTGQEARVLDFLTYLHFLRWLSSFIVSIVLGACSVGKVV